MVILNRTECADDDAKEEEKGGCSLVKKKRMLVPQELMLAFTPQAARARLVEVSDSEWSHAKVWLKSPICTFSARMNS